MTEIPAIATRRPTGKAPWPMLCIAGVEKAGKSYSAALLSASDLVDRTFYIEIGEGAADQYGGLPGVRYEIVEHDGSYDGIGAAIWAATMQPRENGKPHAIVVDSATELWDMVCEEQQLKANQRAAAKAADQGKPEPAEDAQISIDLWNVAKKKWRKIIDMLRVYDGPTILLTRMELVTVMANGKPTTEREWKIRAEKNLGYECDGIIKMYAPQVAKLSGVRSTRLQVPPGAEMPLPSFTIDNLLRRMGLDGTISMGPRSYTAPRPQDAEELQDRPMQRRQSNGPVDDEWSTTPEMAAESMAVPRARPPQPMTDAMQKKMFALMSQKGYGDRVAGLVFLSKVVGREITSSKMLTKANGKAVIDALEALPDPGVARSDMAAYDALMLDVKGVADGEADPQGVEADIAAELAAGQITEEQAATLRQGLNATVDRQMAGAAS